MHVEPEKTASSKFGILGRFGSKSEKNKTPASAAEKFVSLGRMLAMADYAKVNFGGFLPSGNEASHGVDMPPLS